MRVRAYAVNDYTKSSAIAGQGSPDIVLTEGITVVIGHPFMLLREGIAQVLIEAGFKVVGHAGDWTGVHKISTDLHPDVILLDVGLAGYGSNGIMALADKAVIVVITPPNMTEQAATAIRSGAKGYLSVDRSAQEFVQALRIIAKGDVIISGEAVEAIISSISIKAPTEPHSNNLTDRETEVLSLLGSGLTNHEIGNRLYVSEHTVKVHLRNVLTKLNLRNRQQAAVYAAQQGLVKEENKGDTPS
jgi:DNA-binding NarL/FixJ family response regulator